MSSSVVNDGLFSLVRSGPRDTLCCVTGSGAKVTTGTISLRSHSCMVIDHTCNGMLLSNLTIRGARPSNFPLRNHSSSFLLTAVPTFHIFVFEGGCHPFVVPFWL